MLIGKRSAIPSEILQRRGRYYLAPRDPGDPATLPTLIITCGSINPDDSGIEDERVRTHPAHSQTELADRGPCSAGAGERAGRRQSRVEAEFTLIRCIQGAHVRAVSRWYLTVFALFRSISPEISLDPEIQIQR